MHESSPLSITGTFGRQIVDSLRIGLNQVLVKANHEELTTLLHTFSFCINNAPNTVIFPVWPFTASRLNEIALMLCYFNPASPIFSEDRMIQVTIPPVTKINVVGSLPVLLMSLSVEIEKELKKAASEIDMAVG
jgi:hypothetical protein